MTEAARLTGATPGLGKYWKAIDWQTVEAQVKRLQMRIAKAARGENWNGVKSLQWILTHSFNAKLLAVRRATSNKGARTPGIDGEVWKSPLAKMKAVVSLTRRGYKAKPLRRIHIPKKRGKKRPLGIPTIRDRAMQALYLLALEPVEEATSDPNSYGFKRYRGCRDAIGQCFCALAKKYSPTWVLDADIKACFDRISHEWLLDNIPMDKRMLGQWLKSGYITEGKLFPTRQGTPQGGILSPTLANMTLNGLERALKAIARRSWKVNIIRYADDLVVTAATRECMINEIMPVIKEFLAERGLELSQEKTRIVHIEEGFDFLGQNLRKYNNRLIIKPTKDSQRSIVGKVKKIIKEHRGTDTQTMIYRLNPVVRGWANYHRYVQSGKVFHTVQKLIQDALFKWARRRNGNKTPKWIRHHYWGISHDKRHFSCMVGGKTRRVKALELVNVPDIRLARYIKIKGAADPYNPEYQEYFKMRKKWRNMSLLESNSLVAAGLL